MRARISAAAGLIWPQTYINWIKQKISPYTSPYFEAAQKKAEPYMEAFVWPIVEYAKDRLSQRFQSTGSGLLEPFRQIKNGFLHFFDLSHAKFIRESQETKKALEAAYVDNGIYFIKATVNQAIYLALQYPQLFLGNNVHLFNLAYLSYAISSVFRVRHGIGLMIDNAFIYNSIIYKASETDKQSEIKQKKELLSSKKALYTQNPSEALKQEIQTITQSIPFDNQPCEHKEFSSLKADVISGLEFFSKMSGVEALALFPYVSYAKPFMKLAVISAGLSEFPNSNKCLECRVQQTTFTFWWMVGLSIPSEGIPFAVNVGLYYMTGIELPTFVMSTASSMLYMYGIIAANRIKEPTVQYKKIPDLFYYPRAGLLSGINLLSATVLKFKDSKLLRKISDKINKWQDENPLLTMIGSVLGGAVKLIFFFPHFVSTKYFAKRRAVNYLLEKKNETIAAQIKEGRWARGLPFSEKLGWISKNIFSVPEKYESTKKIFEFIVTERGEQFLRFMESLYQAHKENITNTEPNLVTHRENFTMPEVAYDQALADSPSSLPQKFATLPGIMNALIGDEQQFSPASKKSVRQSIEEDDWEQVESIKSVEVPLVKKDDRVQVEATKSVGTEKSTEVLPILPLEKLREERLKQDKKQKHRKQASIETFEILDMDTVQLSASEEKMSQHWYALHPKPVKVKIDKKDKQAGTTSNLSPATRKKIQ